MMLQADPRRMPRVIAVFESYPQKIFVRIALHVLAKKPDAAPELAEKYLQDPELIDSHWCAEEYAELALAWFPSLGANKRQVVLGVVDAVPARYRIGWEQRFIERYDRRPSDEDVRRYEAATVRDVLWLWRAALPPARQEALAKAAAEFGDPDAWKVPFWGQGEASPLDIGGPCRSIRRGNLCLYLGMAAWRGAAKANPNGPGLRVAQSSGTRPG